MTSQKDQIQALIADIDGVLQKATPRLPWIISGEVTHQRQTLERVRNYLVALQRKMAIQDGYGQELARPDLLAHDIYSQPGNPAGSGDLPQASARQEMTAQQMLQTVMEEMGYLRSNVMQPLQADLEILRQQREALAQEIQQLESQRQGYGVPLANQQQIINEFLQALMGRLQETLPQQVAQSLRGAGNQPFPHGSNPALPVSGAAIPVSYPQPLEGLQQSQPTADQLVVNLDSALKLIFESLERNVQAYEKSLTQGLERMHGLGKQGEMMFSALVNHLAQQLGREASSFLQSSGQFIELGSPQEGSQGEKSQTGASVPPQTDTSGAVKPRTTPSTQTTFTDDFRLPYPGTELPLSEPLEEAVSPDLSVESPSSGSVDAAIDAWLKSASALSGGQDSPSVPNLDMPGLRLAELDLNQIDPQEIDAILEMETGDVGDYLTNESSAQTTNLPFAGTTPASSEEDTTDIDAALKLLEQLSSDLEEVSDAVSLEDAEAEIDRMLSSAQSPMNMRSASERISDDARDELDEFYESLFGPDAEAFEPSEASASAGEVEPAIAQASVAEPDHLDQAPVSDPTLGWDLPLEEPRSHEPVTETESTMVGESNPLLTELAESAAADPPLLIEPAAADPQLLAGIETEEVPLLEEAATTEAPLAREDEISSLTDLFEDVMPAEGSFAQESGIASSDGVALTGQQQAIDLFQSSFSASSEQVGSIESAEDSYTPAAPEEDLLSADESMGATASGLWLDEFTLNSLNEDLSSLETGTEAGNYAQLEDEPTLADWETDQLHSPETDQQSLAELTDLADSALTDSTVNQEHINQDQISARDESGVEIQSEPSSQVTDAFTLEGMDDLFGDLPPAPEVSPAAPPGLASSDEPPLFTLEGMDNLFSEPDSLTSSPAPPPGSEVSTDLSLQPEAKSPDFELEDASLVATPPDLVNPPPVTDQAIPFTLEGMDALFSDVASVSPSAPENVTAPVEDSPSAFTLEGMDDLFGDVPSLEEETPKAESEPISPPAPTDDLTLERMGNLFSELAPETSVSSTDLAERSTPHDQRSNFTLERVGDVLMEVPTSAMVEPSTPVSNATTANPEAFTLEQMGDVFVEVPATVQQTSDPGVSAPQDETDDFSLEQLGSMFGEVPASEQQVPDPAPATSAAEADVFSLEQVGDLFAEVPAVEQPSSNIAPATSVEEPDIFSLEQMADLFEAAPSTGEPPSNSPFKLEEENPDLFFLEDEGVGEAFQASDQSLDAESFPDQGFENLMGNLEAPPSASDSSETAPWAGEKKKRET